ncbi:Hypothetical_protein [Hexamita inflata]|uniref:Hypothetical_protein n=1 Tax=Hexamita inflata TaxID=28002 RepID=A0AA86TT98_9EUKA|nr:Hypothetical protein HINF_LOCUS15794 [Hexamita inflata]
MGSSLQQFDLLCILGGPKSGKTSSMYISAIFMLNFVRMIRPQSFKRRFCQNITKLIEINCALFSGTYLNKMKQLYFFLSKYIIQDQKDMDKVEGLTDVINVTKKIEEMFENAQCYFVITWDEIQALNIIDQTESKTMKLEQENYLSTFLKNIMISVNSPCQHLASGSLSVALLTFLKNIPVNGQSIMNCQQAIVTSSKDNEQQLNLVISLKQLNEETKQYAQKQAIRLLQLNSLSLTCADLDQILSVKQELIGANQKILAEAARKLKSDKLDIALEWIKKSSQSVTSYNMEIHNLIVGTKNQPSILLAKLCSFNDTSQIYQIIDNSLRDSLKIQLDTMNEQNQMQNYYNYSAVLLQAGNYMYYVKKSKDQKVMLDTFWSQIDKQNLQKTVKQQQIILEIQEQFYFQTEQDNLTFKLLKATNESEQNTLRSKLKNWQDRTKINDFKNLSKTAWKNGYYILERLRRKYSHDNQDYLIDLTKNLECVFVGSVFLSMKKFVLALEAKIIQLQLQKIDQK